LKDWKTEIKMSNAAVTRIAKLFQSIRKPKLGKECACPTPKEK